MIRILILVFIFISGYLSAQPIQKIEISNSDNELHHSERTHHNHIAIFIGGTRFDKKSKTYFSLGVDYAYIPSAEKTWAFSIFGEIVFADHNEYLIGLPVFYYISRSLWLRAGPGIEIIQVEDNHHTKSHIEMLFRVGAGYEFHLGEFSITPSLDYDFVRNNDALVFGLNFGYGF